MKYKSLKPRTQSDVRNNMMNYTLVKAEYKEFTRDWNEESKLKKT